METYTVKISVKYYIKQFFESRYGKPAELPKRTFFNALLYRLLMKPPSDFIPKPEELNTEEQWLEIKLPSFENKDIRSYNYISQVGLKRLKFELRTEFYTDMYKYVKEFMCEEFKKDYNAYICLAIQRFIEDYGLDPKCYDTLIKQYNRSELAKRRGK